MKNRKERIGVMIDLISNRRIGSQLELSLLLKERGFSVTQATLSRDMKMLRTTKVPTERGGYIYLLPDNNRLKDRLLEKGEADVSPDFRSGFISVHISRNIAVIKTRNGYAAGLAYDIDMAKINGILGTIPGSDTIFVVMDEDLDRERMMEILGLVLPLDKKHHKTLNHKK